MTAARREHMTETFIAVSDALRRSIVPTVGVILKAMPDMPRPWYLPEVPPQTVAEYRAALAKLGHLGLVKGAN
jgi:hypothetical protein